jgi:glutaredoxin
MKKLLFASIFCLLALLSLSIAEAQIYKYVDENGRVHYTNIPPRDSQSRQKVEKVEPKGNVTVMGNEEDEPEHPPERSMSVLDYLKEKLSMEEERVSEQPQEHEYGDNQVDLYVTSWCGYCKKARKFLISKGIDFNEYDIEKDEEAARRKRELDGRRGVPFAVINGHKIHGWSQPAYERALNLN